MPEIADNRNSYSSIFKSIGLFGGVKVFQILISIIRNKFVAVLLGPIGMGVVGILTSTTSMVNALTGFGLHTSSVRDIAKATKSNDNVRIGIIVDVLRKLVILTGLLGTVVTFIFAPLLSQWSFGNGDYTVAYRLISVVLFLDQLCIGQTALMQGTFHYRYMANSSIWGSIIGLVVSVPFYYLYGEKAIVPVIIIASITNLLLSWFYSRKINIQKVSLSSKEIWHEGKGMLILGLSIALTGVFGTGTTYLLRSSISRIGSIADVGLYTAGIAIATQYINIILQSMGSDYSPRLATMSDNREAFIETINRQMKLMLTIVTPLLIPFIVFIKEFTNLLYSTKFLAITGMIEWIMFGMFFRTISWCLSYSIIARGQSKTFFWNETAACVYNFILMIVGYKVASFTGMGIAFCLNYMIYTIQMYILCRHNFGFRFSKDTLQNATFLLLLLIVSFITVKLLKYTALRYVIGSALCTIVCYISFRILDKMIPVKETIKSFIQKVRK